VGDRAVRYLRLRRRNRVGTLSTGQRRLVELARCAAGAVSVCCCSTNRPSGLDRIETERFGEILTRVVAERRVGILLIEHDMALVNRICDYIYVIDFGKAIFQGTVGEVGASAVVRARLPSGDEGSAAIARGLRRTWFRSEHHRRRAPIRSCERRIWYDPPCSGKCHFRYVPGHVVALLGPNGAGKNDGPAHGQWNRSAKRRGMVSLDGRRPGERGNPQGARHEGLCLIPEGRGIFKSLTVRENLRLQVPAGEARSDEAIGRALTVFPALKDRMKDAVGHLSGGQQQMLSLARAYVTSPRVIMLDEVSMGLAPRVADEMFPGTAHPGWPAGTAMLMVEQYVTRARWRWPISSCFSIRELSPTSGRLLNSMNKPSYRAISESSKTDRACWPLSPANRAPTRPVSGGA